MSQRLPRFTARKLLRVLTKKRAGFFICHEDSDGSHVQLCHPDDPTILVTIAMHPGDLKHGTLLGILKQAKLSRQDFLKLL